MENFSFNNPTKLIFGRNTVSKIGNELKERGIKKVLYLFGKGSIFKNGVYETSTSSLRNENIEYVELGGVKANPVLSKVYEAIELCRMEKVDGILAVGGGSVLDSAKAIGAGALYEGDVWDFFSGKARCTKSLPVFDILTISATGSEMNPYGVITKEDEKKKWAFGGGLSSYPVVSIVDPTVQYSLPKEQTVNGAADIISHVMENYFDGSENTDFQDEYAEGIIRTVMHHTEVLLDDPQNYESRAQLALCATMALNGIISMGRFGGDWATHQLEHSVSAFTDVAHGAGLAILFPNWIRHVIPENPNRFAKFANRVFNYKGSSTEDEAWKSAELLEDFYRQIGAPTKLSEIGVDEKLLPQIVDNAAISVPFGRFKKLEREDIEAIYKLAL